MWLRGCSSLWLWLLLALVALPVQGQELSPADRCAPGTEALLREDPAAARERLEAAAAESPSDLCDLAMGEAFLREGNDFWAVNLLARARAALAARYGDAHPTMRRARWLLCLALARTEQWEDAATLCDGAAVSPEAVPAVDFYGGIAAFKAGDDPTAIRRLQRARRDLSPARYRDSADRYLELSIGRLAGVRPGVDAELGSSAGYDSNALMAPDDPMTVGIVGEVAAFKSLHWMSLGYRFRNVGRTVVALRGNAARSFHYASPADSINATDLGASASVQRHSVLDSGRMAWEARYGYRVTWLDGGPATLEEEPFGFVESHSLSLGPSFWDAGGNGYSLRYAVANQRFAERVRNGWAQNLSIGEEFRLAENLSLAIAQSGSLSLGTDAYSRWGASLGTFLAWQPVYRWTVTVRGTGQYEDYYGSRGYFDDQERRTDWLFVARGEVEWSFGPGLAVGAYGGASGRRSSVEVLSYDKLEGGLQLRWANGGW
jgi:hypothetical protein